MTATELFEASIQKVQSRSIRAWAKSAHNKPLWLEICQTAIHNNKHDSDAMAAYMVCVAMG